MENLKDLLEDELEGPVEDLSRSLRKEGGRTVSESTRGYIERLANQVDNILARAWAVTLDQVGEEVTVGSPPPKRRLNQKGHIRRAIGKKYKLLLKQESTLRRIHRKVVQCVENAGELTTGLEQETRGILNVPQNGEVGHSNATPSELQDRLREALANSTRERRHMLGAHDRDNKLKRLKQFQLMLTQTPKRAH
eukprot:1016049-Prorocentrum_minimum.AAC.1